MPFFIAVVRQEPQHLGHDSLTGRPFNCGCLNVNGDNFFLKQSIR